MKAEELFQKIGTGRENAVSRLTNQHEDRQFRILVSKANKNGDIIVHGKEGYYRPDFSKSEEMAEFNTYLRKEWHRVKDIMKKLVAMKKARKEQEEASA